MENNDTFFIDELSDLFLVREKDKTVVDVLNHLMQYTLWKIKAIITIQLRKDEGLFPQIIWNNDLSKFVAIVSYRQPPSHDKVIKEQIDFQIFDWRKRKGFETNLDNIVKVNKICSSEIDNVADEKAKEYLIGEQVKYVFSAIMMDCSLILFHSVLSGEYAMQDSFSDILINILDKIQPYGLISNDDLGDGMTYFQQTVVAKILAPMLSDYINFNTYIEAQIDKKPSNILSNRDNTLFRRQDYERKLNVFVSQNSDLEKFLRLIPFVFHELLEMTKVDQNFYYSKDRLYTLMYLDELINGFSDREYKSDRAFRNLVDTPSVNAVLGKNRVLDIQNMLDMVSVKTRFLISKIMLCCHNSVRDLIYVGWGNKYVFDARKCYDKQQGKSERTRLLTDSYFKSIPVRENEPKRIKSDLWNLFEYASNNCNGEVKDVLENSAMDYEIQYINRYDKNEKGEMVYGDSWYKAALRSVSGVGGTDIRHYNTKVLEMARDAVNDTAVLKGWINNNRYNFDEQKGFEQIKIVLTFLQIRYDETVCYDSEMLLSYAHWCIDFLELVSKNSAMSNSNNLDRPTRIEEGLLLLEILNGLIRRLIENIESGEYCVPFASKFRGCFCTVIDNKDDNILKVDRIFIDSNKITTDKNPTYKMDEFKYFVDPHGYEKGKKTFPLDKRKQILFIASTFNGPVNYEELKIERDSLRTKTSKLRNEIHTEYFDRVRGSIKEDMNEKLDENKRSVIQILSIFAALLALTTTALSGVTAGKSGQFYLMVMLGFVLCLGVFILLLHFIVLNKDYWKSKEKNEKELSLMKTAAGSLGKEIQYFEKHVLERVVPHESKVEKANDSQVNSGGDSNTEINPEQLACINLVEVYDSLVDAYNSTNNFDEIRERSEFLNKKTQDIIDKIDKKRHWYIQSPFRWLIIGMFVVAIILGVLVFISPSSVHGNNNIDTQINVSNNAGQTPETAIDIANGEK